MALSSESEEAQTRGVQFIHACSVVQKMCEIFNTRPPQTLAKKIQDINELVTTQKSRKNASKETFEEDFDEQDCGIIVGDFFSAERTKHGEYYRNALEMGLQEGRDFRVLGMDDNLKGLCNLNNQKERLDCELAKKHALLAKFHGHGVLKALGPLNDRSNIVAWENTFNRWLFEWALLNKERVLQMLNEQKVETISQLKSDDLILDLLQKK